MSRQVKAEAEHIFYNENLFVRFSLNVAPVSRFQDRIEPFVLARDKVARRFKHHAITLDLDIQQLSSFYKEFWQLDDRSYFMLAGEDMPWLARTLGITSHFCEVGRPPFLVKSFLSISAVDSFEGATTSNGGRSCLDYERLSKLLEPLYHLGIEEAHLYANVSVESKHRILKSIQSPPLGVKASMDKVLTSTEAGDEAFRCGRHLQAICAYQEALDYVHPFYGLSELQISGPIYPTGKTLNELFSKLFNRQRAARIRLEIGRKASDLTRFAQSGEDVLNESVRAGVDYAIHHFSNPRSFGVKNTQYRPSYLRLATQLEIIEDFNSDPRMKKALIKALVAIMKDNSGKSSYMKQWMFGCWDHWFLEI